MVENRQKLRSFCVGTLWEDEELEKNESYHDQFAKDGKGRRRFHGAFTGGFSAGYFNTVGSEKGWAPSQFESSRGNRGNFKQQNIMDFMDDEDLGSDVAGSTIVARQGFNSVEPVMNQFESPVNHSNQEFQFQQRQGKLDNFFNLKQDSVGYEILKNLKEATRKQSSLGNLIKKKIQEEGQKESYSNKHGLKVLENDYIRVSDIKGIKNDFFGLGFSEIGASVYMDEDDRTENEFNSVLKTLASKYEAGNVLLQHKEVGLGKASNRIGFGDFSGEQDQQEEFSRYVVTTDRTESGDVEQHQQMPQVGRTTLENFVRTTEENIASQKVTQKNVAIPENYDSLEGARKRLKVSEDSKHQEFSKLKTKHLGVADRAKILGEKFVTGGELSGKDEFLTLKTQNFMSKLSEKSRTMLLGNNKFVESSTQVSNNSERDLLDMIFQDRSKNERYRLYVQSKDNSSASAIRYPLGFRASDINKEILEFERIFAERNVAQAKDEQVQTQQEKLLCEISDMKKKIDTLKNSRIKTNWLPPKILCMRYGIEQPKIQTDFQSHHNNKRNDFEKHIMPSILEDLQKNKIQMESETKLPKISEDSEMVSIVGEGLIPDENNASIAKAPQKLFDAIFNEDEEDF